MKPYFAYIRVSTPKQGKGVSLEEQQAAIQAFAARHDLTVTEWFEEKETAAKTGRAVFSKMLSRLEKGEAKGVVIHKIDRSARNLWDWAALSKLFDCGVDVQFAHDSVDLNSRGGRLSADIMAIVAADYVRNLREEVKKGFRGRLRQGIYPLPAPIGYLDTGSGNPKIIDSERAPLVQGAFERYATGTVSLRQLRKWLCEQGLRPRRGGTLSLQGVSVMLRNPFYIGLIRVKTTGETFPGKHPPLVRPSTFEQVQAILNGKTVSTVLKHNFVFRRLVRCETCGLHLIGEKQKGHVYYRCHSDSCGTSVREELIDDIVQKNLKLLIRDPREMREIGDMVMAERAKATEGIAQVRESLQLRIAKCDGRMSKLTDALIDGLIDKSAFEPRKETLLMERQRLLDDVARCSEADLPRHAALAHLELGNAAYSGYRSGNSDERRRIVMQATSNLSARGKEPVIALKSPFQEVANWRKVQNGGPYRSRPRKRAKQLLDIVIAAAPSAQKYSIARP